MHHPVPQHANPTDHALDVVSTDFIADSAERSRHIDELAEQWEGYAEKHAGEHGARASEGQLTIDDSEKGTVSPLDSRPQGTKQNFMMMVRQTTILIERNMINYSRNLLAYGVRLGMYRMCRCVIFPSSEDVFLIFDYPVGMGFLLATVWVNLAQTSEKVVSYSTPMRYICCIVLTIIEQNDRLSVHFFAVAFLGFMSVAGLPAYLEERQVFVRERMNGLYGPGAYVLANSICTFPYLFVCSLLFTVLWYVRQIYDRRASEPATHFFDDDRSYWSIGLNPGANQFFRFLAILFLAVYAAESQVRQRSFDLDLLEE